MKNLAPNITRQRLLIEGFYGIEADEETIIDYFDKITTELDLRMDGDPIVFKTLGDEGKGKNQGYDAFVPLIDSGISVYVWAVPKFLSVIIYTCKQFDEEAALAFTKTFWDIKEIVFKSF